MQNWDAPDLIAEVYRKYARTTEWFWHIRKRKRNICFVQTLNGDAPVTKLMGQNLCDKIQWNLQALSFEI
jgi:hypothetical protein